MSNSKALKGAPGVGGGGGGKVGVERGGGNDVEKVVNLEGENLKMMKKAIEGCKLIDFGLFGDLTQKKVAIDDGVNVVFRWS